MTMALADTPSERTPYPGLDEVAYAVDVLSCGCPDPANCRCPADGGGCRNGFCFCTHDSRLEYDERRCHPAYKSKATKD